MGRDVRPDLTDFKENHNDCSNYHRSDRSRHLDDRPCPLHRRLLCEAPHGEQGPRQVRHLSGTITVAEDGTSSVQAEIDVTSISTGNDQRDGHIRSADFFDAEKFPTATFVSTGVAPKGDDYVLTGDFTLKGVTKPVELELEFNGVNPGMGQGPVAGFEAKTVINRKDFGIDIEMPLEGGGVVVGDKVTITLEIEAGQPAA